MHIALAFLYFSLPMIQKKYLLCLLASFFTSTMAIDNKSDSLFWNTQHIIPKEKTTLEYLMEHDDDKSKKIILYFYAEWCAPCHKFKNNVLNKTNVKEFCKRYYYNLQINYDDSINKNLCKTYNIQALPTLCFLDSIGNLLAKIEGYVDGDNFISFAKKIQNEEEKILWLNEKIRKGDYDMSLLWEYMQYDKRNQALAMHLMSIKFPYLSKSEKMSESFWALFSQYAETSLYDLFIYVISNYQEYKKLYGFGVEEKILTSIQDNDSCIIAYLKEETPELYMKYEKRCSLRPFFAKAAQNPYSKDNWKYLAKELSTYFDNQCSDPYFINNVNWELFCKYADKVPKSLLRKAKKWQYRAVKLIGDEHRIIDTYACLQRYIGNQKSAIFWESKAIDLALANNDTVTASNYRKNLKNFESKEKYDSLFTEQSIIGDWERIINGYEYHPLLLKHVLKKLKSIKKPINNAISFYSGISMLINEEVFMRDKKNRKQIEKEVKRFYHFANSDFRASLIYGDYLQKIGHLNEALTKYQESRLIAIENNTQGAVRIIEERINNISNGKNK